MKINNIRFDGLGDFKDKNVYFPESDSYAEIVDKKDILDWYRDYKYNRKRGYDVENETFIFIYKDGTYKFCYGMSDPIVEKLTNLIYASNANASGEYVWFDNKPKYLPIIQNVTGMEIAKLDGIKQLQNYSSAKTSLPNNEPKGFKLIDWQKNTVNLDLGGGKTTFGTDYLKKYGVKNLIYDFNYSAKHNKEIAEYVKDNKVDTVTCFNVLNVLDTDAAIENMCLMAAKALKSDGTAYFQVYNKGSKGASQNNQSFQQGEPLSFYVPFVEKYFGKVKKTADLIIATKPIKTTKKSQWQFAFDSNEGLLFGVDNGKNLSGTHYKQLDITEYKFLYKDKEFIFKVGDTIIFKPKSENNQTEIKKIVCFEEQNAACKNGWAHEIWICWDDNTNEPVYSVAGTMYKTSLNEYDIVGYKAYNITLQELELQLLNEESPLKITIETFENIVKQYNSLKQNSKYKDVILIFATSKYEQSKLCSICEKDAEIAGKILKVKPTKLGLIFHRYYLEEYLSKLTRAGYRVGIVEEKKGLKGLGEVQHKFNVGDLIIMPAGLTGKIIGIVDGDKYLIEYYHSVTGAIKNVLLYIWKVDEKAKKINKAKPKTTDNIVKKSDIELPSVIREVIDNTDIKCMLEKEPHKRGSKIIKKHSILYRIEGDTLSFRSYYISEKIFNYLKNNRHIPCNPASIALYDYKVQNYNKLWDTISDITSYFIAIDEYWESLYLHYEDDDCRRKLLRQYTVYTTAEQYIEDAKQYALLREGRFHRDNLICYKGFEETIFQIVGFKGNNYIVVELGDRTRTKKEIPFADKDKLQKAVSPLLIQEIKLVNNNNSLSGIVQPFYPDHDTDDYLNDYSESKSATQAFLNDVKNFVKRLKKDLELEDYYNKGKKQTITINARDIYVQLVIPYAEKPNTYLRIEFHTNHLLWQYKGLLKGINYDYNVEPTFTIWVGEASCWFNIWNDYDDILKELKYKYSIFRDRKQQTEVSPLLTKELQLLLTKYEFYQYLKK